MTDEPMRVVAIHDIEYTGQTIPKGTHGAVIENDGDPYLPYLVNFGLPELFWCGNDDVVTIEEDN